MTVPTTPDSNQTSLHQLLETKLGTDLDEYIIAARKDGKTYIRIAEDLRNQTEVYVTHESIRRWYVKLQPETDAA